MLETMVGGTCSWYVYILI